MQIEEINYNDECYPKRLKNIDDPPKKLYVLGNKNILNYKGIAIVGSRDCTDKGKEIAKIFGANLANAGFSIISGMAKGIDAEAHMGALEVNGNTIAVLGCGVDYVYPQQNIELYNEILEKGGVIVSEYPSKVEPTSEYFRKRNRIVSGLSLGILVVEAEYRSGTSITVGYAKVQGRDIFCIPNAIDNNKGIGTNILIQKGANLVIEPKEIIEKYMDFKPKQLSIIDILENKKNKLKSVKKEYRKIYECLQNGELGINEISIQTGLCIAEIYQKLVMMELEGIIEFKQNKYWLVA